MSQEDMPKGWKEAKRASEITTAWACSPEGKQVILIIMADESGTAFAHGIYSFDEAETLARDILEQCEIGRRGAV